MKSGAGLQKTGNSSAVQVLLATLNWRTLFAISGIEVNDTVSISGQIEP